MELHQAARRDRRQTWILGLAFLVAIFVAGAPVVQAATQRVNVTKSVPIRVKDTNNGRIDAEVIGPLGSSLAPGSPGALSVQTFAGGGGLLGAGDCNAIDADGKPNLVTVAADPETKITAIIVTGPNADVSVEAPAIYGQGNPVATFSTSAGEQNVFIGLGNGLTVFPSALEFECPPTGDGNFVLLGQ